MSARAAPAAHIIECGVDARASIAHARITCRRVEFPVGILRPDWLSGAEWLGQRRIRNITVNGWTKVVHWVLRRLPARCQLPTHAPTVCPVSHGRALNLIIMCVRAG